MCSVAVVVVVLPMIQASSAASSNWSRSSGSSEGCAKA